MQVYLNSQKRTRTVSTKFAEKVDEHFFMLKKIYFEADKNKSLNTNR